MAEARYSLPMDISARAFKPVVVNPEAVSYWLEIVLPAKSFAPVVTRILYVVFKEKLLLGLVLKIVLPAEVVVLNVVLSEDELSEDELSEVELSELVEDDICMQVLKLSVETWMVPEQVVSEVLVLNVELSIGSEKVTEMLEVEDTDVVVFAGETDDTVGAVVSNLKA